jgi:hypothetical protein
MELDKAISKKRVIELELFNGKLHYSGVCVKATKDFWLIVNFDFDKGSFDGFSVFRNTDIDYFSVYVKKNLQIKKDNLVDFTELLPNLNNINTFNDCLDVFSSFGLIAFFLEKKLDSYSIGRVLSIDNKNITIQTVNTDASFGKKRRIGINKINFFSFHSSYEKELEHPNKK